MKIVEPGMGGDRRVWAGTAVLLAAALAGGAWLVTTADVPSPHRPPLVLSSPPVTQITVHPFPLGCAEAAYCDLGIDSICTIIYVAEAESTPYDAILEGVAGEVAWGRLRREDFADCPFYLFYLDDALD